MDFSNTKISLKRPITSYSKVQNLISTVVRNRAFHINRKMLDRKEYLDLGCGLNPHADFINLDYWWKPYIDICWDISYRLPLRSEAVKGIYTEHCLEHVPLETADYVLSECWRVLKPGGILRVIVPDGQLYLKLYVRIIEGESSVRMPLLESDGYHGLYSPMMSVNRIFYFGHRFIYDFDTLGQLLSKNGFIKIKKESFRSGRDPILLIDQEARAVESLYVEASKPDEPGQFVEPIVSGTTAPCRDAARCVQEWQRRA